MRRLDDAVRRAFEWPRRRFLAAGASAAGLLAAGARWSPPPAAAHRGGGGADPRPQVDLPIQGSPYLLSSDPAAAGPGLSPEARLVHFHLPPEARDRLLLGIP